MKPQWRISIAGADLSDAIGNRFVSLRIEDEVGFKSDTLTLTLDDRDFRLALPRIGAELTAAIGWQGGALYDAGSFIVDELTLTGPLRQLTVTARAADTRDEPAALAGMKAARTRSWHDTTLGEIIRTIAKEEGFTPSVDPTFDAIPIAHEDQVAESNAHFLTRLGYWHGAAVKPAKGKLWFGQVGAGRPGPGHGRFVEVAARDVSDWSVTLGYRQKYASVQAQWWNLDTGAMEVEDAGVGGSGPPYQLKDTFPSKAAAERAAQAKAADLRRAGHSLRLRMIGLPSAIAEASVIVSGFRPGIDGSWIAKKVVHEISSSGYRTDIEATKRLEEDPEAPAVAEPETWENPNVEYADDA